MRKLPASLNVVLLSGILFTALFTWLAPKAISALFTPPVSFGTNCEPAAAWSMSKLIWTQISGFGFGLILSALYLVTRKSVKTSAVDLDLPHDSKAKV